MGDIQCGYALMEDGSKLQSMIGSQKMVAIS